MTQVSVLMTVWNGLPYVKETLESLFVQTFQDFCIVLVDNGCTDGFADYIATLPEEQRAKLQITHLPENIGRTPALNLGLAQITSPYTAVLDADDLSQPQRLAKQVAFLDANPDITLVASDIERIDENGKHLGVLHFNRTPEAICNAMPLTNQIAHSSCMYRTEAAKQLGLYPKEYVYAQDQGMWVTMLAAGKKMAMLPEPLVGIREHSAQETRNTDKNILRVEESIRLARAMAEISGMSKLSQQAALLRGAILAATIKDWRNAITLLCKAFMRSPLTFATNPIIWQRIRALLA